MVDYLIQDKSASWAKFDQSTHEERWDHQQKWEVIRDQTLVRLVGIKSNSMHDCLAIGIVGPRHRKGYPVSLIPR